MPSYDRNTSPNFIDCLSSFILSTSLAPTKRTTYIDIPASPEPRKTKGTSHVGSTMSTSTPSNRSRHTHHHASTSTTTTLSNASLWTLYHFETHATTCPTCHNPHRNNAPLCKVGHPLAGNVADLVYSKHDGAKTYRVATSYGERIRVELPGDYVQVRSLLRAEEAQQRPRGRPEIPDREIVREASPAESRNSSTTKRSDALSSRTGQRAIRLERPRKRVPEIVHWPDENLDTLAEAPVRRHDPVTPTQSPRLSPIGTPALSTTSSDDRGISPSPLADYERWSSPDSRLGFEKPKAGERRISPNPRVVSLGEEFVTEVRIPTLIGRAGKRKDMEPRGVLFRG